MEHQSNERRRAFKRRAFFPLCGNQGAEYVANVQTEKTKTGASKEDLLEVNRPKAGGIGPGAWKLNTTRRKTAAEVELQHEIACSD